MVWYVIIAIGMQTCSLILIHAHTTHILDTFTCVYLLLLESHFSGAAGVFERVCA